MVIIGIQILNVFQMSTGQDQRLIGGRQQGIVFCGRKSSAIEK